jgi:hypothetical protein
MGQKCARAAAVPMGGPMAIAFRGATNIPDPDQTGQRLDLQPTAAAVPMGGLMANAFRGTTNIPDPDQTGTAV